MPTYEYQCKQCSFQFDKFQSILDSPLQKCPQCGGILQRVITGGSGFVLKGSGFYQNDYKKQDTCCSKGESCDNPKRCCEQ